MLGRWAPTSVALPYHRLHHRATDAASQAATMAASLRHLSTSAAAPHHRRPNSFHRLALAAPPPLRSRLTRVYALSSNDIRAGSNVEVDGAPWKVLEFLHVKPGKGAAFVRTKMRNYITGNTVDKTFRAGSTIPEASISKETKQFTYKDGSQFVFMDLTSFEETRLNESDVGDRQKWLKEGMDCNLLYWNGRIIDFDLPITVRLTVTDTDPGQGDSAQGGTKPATVETGAVVTVPSFVNVGDDILIDSRTGQYMNRA
ncbi:elongation factor P-like [Oryza brachyantha]|nr:elongation factor P-like [Oryza brachyantha]